MTEHRTTVAPHSTGPFGPRYHWTCRCNAASRDTYRTAEEAQKRAQAHTDRKTAQVRP